MVGLVNPAFRSGWSRQPPRSGLDSRPIERNDPWLFASHALAWQGISLRNHSPAGKAETILDIPAYDFNWQLFYRLAQPWNWSLAPPSRPPAGLTIAPTIPPTPIPTRWCAGAQTTDEMMLGYVEYIVPVGQSARMGLPGRLGVPGNLIQAWQNADKNRDARLSKEEFAVCSQIARTITRGLIAEKAFERLDSNKDGFLTPDEILKARSAAEKKTRWDGQGPITFLTSLAWNQANEVEVIFLGPFATN